MAFLPTFVKILVLPLLIENDDFVEVTRLAVDSTNLRERCEVFFLDDCCWHAPSL